MKKIVLGLIALSFPLAAQQPASPQTPLPPAATVTVDYDKDVRPLLAEHCYACHGDAIQQSGLRLDLRQNALRGGDYGPVIVPGKSADSKLIRRLVDGDGGLQMPPTGPLSADDIGILRAWIDQGAEFRNDVVERPARPVDPKLAALISAARSNPPEMSRLLAAGPEQLTATDAGGSTILHHAAGFGTVQTMTDLIGRGADVNARNRRGSMPLHWAIHDVDKVRLLLDRGASINAKQVEGRTPLYLAASLGSGSAVMRLLLERGADPSLSTAVGQTPLMVVATRGDLVAARLLLDAKVDVNARNGAGETALMLAATSGNPDVVGLLLARGADARVRSKRNETALGNAGTAGIDEIVRLLLDAGGDVNVRNVRGYSPLMLAAGSDAVPAGAVRMLLARGADASFTGDYNETARDLAAKRGDTEVARLLGARVPAAPMASHAGAGRRSIPDAVEQAMSLLEKQSYTFIRTGGCNSCHSQELPSAVAGFARDRGLRVPREIPQLPTASDAAADRLMDFIAVSAPSTAWELFDAGMNGVAPSAYTDAAVRYIKAMQTPDGNLSTNENRRPPMNAGDYQAAALAIYAMKHYGPSGEQQSTAAAIARTVDWLKRTRPQTTQDRAFHALALAWADDRSEAAGASVRALIAQQRTDGGWSQLPGLPSDAYATGQVLYALNVAGRMQPSDTTFKKGIDFLLGTQAPDGSWRVKSRSIWFQPYFESGFPYGQDQFISTAGTAWASMALAAAAAPPNRTQR